MGGAACIPIISVHNMAQKGVDAGSDKPEVADPSFGHTAPDRRGDPKGSGIAKTAVKRSDFNLGGGFILPGWVSVSDTSYDYCLDQG